MSISVTDSSQTISEFDVKENKPLRLACIVIIYLAAAVFSCRGFLFSGDVPGTERSDLWNSLWTWEQVHISIMHFQNPFWNDGLNFPHGGSLWPVDPLGALLTFPLRIFCDLTTAYQWHAVIQLAFIGVATHEFAASVWRERIHWSAPFIAGLGLMFASLTLSLFGVGSSEALLNGFVVFALWRFYAWHDGEGGRRSLFVAVMLAMISNWYAAVMVMLFLVSGAIFSHPSKRAPIVTLILSTFILILPVAFLAYNMTVGPDSIIGAKSPEVLAQVRRTIGPADPFAYIFLDGHIPDFKEISRYGESYRHDVHLGFTLLVLGVAGLFYLPKWLKLGGLLCLIFSMGPVLIQSGTPFLFANDLAIPLPYFLIEDLPGFSSLSLLYRIGFGFCLVLSISAVRYATTLRRTGVLLFLIFIEFIYLSPTAGKIASVTPPSFPKLESQGERRKAVINWPIEGGNKYLFEQTRHQFPLAGGLNFPLNSTSKQYWEKLGAFVGNDKDFCVYADGVAKTLNIRYVVIHHQYPVRPDQTHKTAFRLKEHCSIVSVDERIAIVEHS